ncbi:MAG TPA: hypothetical protein VMR00_07010 [Streptosporangiaceae bacterium]|jgi:DNA-directed RNA polymerase specialized sigma24 family protein|nr:hypothetical protein [Streptosporangiaceae bacterium]
MTGGNGSQRAAPDLRAFAAIFDAHAVHLFDYCRSLLGSADAAAGAAEATLITASAGPPGVPEQHAREGGADRARPAARPGRRRRH